MVRYSHIDGEFGLTFRGAYFVPIFCLKKDDFLPMTRECKCAILVSCKSVDRHGHGINNVLRTSLSEVFKAYFLCYFSKGGTQAW